MAVSSPAANHWDTDAVAARAFAQLRLAPGDDDADRVLESVNEAVELIDAELDRVPPDPDADPAEDPYDASAVPALLDAAVQLTVEVYQRRFVRVDGTSDPALLADASDPLVAVRGLVGPYKTRWGIA